ncbi:hypothetical protein [Catenulispora yoronensis]
MRQAKEETQMAMQAHTAQRKRWCARFNALAIDGALGLLTAAAIAWADPPAASWQVARLVGLLAAGALSVRLAAEAAAYCANDAGRTECRAARVADQTVDLPGVPAVATHSFGQAILPGRQALPSGSAHI